MQTCVEVVNPNDEITLTAAERQPCEIWTRVMGYHRPVASFNRGKQGEYRDRLCFQEARCTEPQA